MNKFKTAVAAVFVLVLIFGAGGAIAYATTYGLSNRNVWHLALDSRPAHLTGDLISSYYLGRCKEGSGTNCPHDGEEGASTLVTATAKTAGGVTMSGWNWVKCGALWDEGLGANTYWMVFSASSGSWPTVLPTGCSGGPCPQWPTNLTCSVTGDDPPGPDDWTGDAASYTVTVGTAIDPNWTGNPNSTIVLSTGKTLIMKKAPDGSMVGAAHFRYTLPPGNYTDGVIQAKKSDGSTWAGVKCDVDENGSGTVDTIVYTVGEFALEHTGGYCVINGANSPVNLVRE